MELSVTVFTTMVGFSSTSVQRGSLNYHHLMSEPSYLIMNHLAWSLTKSFKKIPITLKLFSKVSSFKYSIHIFTASLQNKMINSFKFSMSTIWSLWLLLFYLSTCFNNFSSDNLVFDSVFFAWEHGVLCILNTFVLPTDSPGDCQAWWRTYWQALCRETISDGSFLEREVSFKFCSGLLFL